MGALLALVPVAVVLLTALSRVHAIRGAQVEGAAPREVRLTFVERMRYHRLSLYALAAVLLIGMLGGILHTPASVSPNREVIRTGAFGVLRLTLLSDGYDWDFLPVSGAGDSGHGACH